MAGKRYADYVKKGRTWWQIILDTLLSNVGLGILCFCFAGLGNRDHSKNLIMNLDLKLKHEYE
jgi:hypothetical protein